MSSATNVLPTEASIRGTIRAFERMLPPDRAAERILRGIEKNSARILITREAYLIDYAKRAFPVLSGEVIGRRWKSMGF